MFSTNHSFSEKLTHRAYGTNGYTGIEKPLSELDVWILLVSDVCVCFRSAYVLRERRLRNSIAFRIILGEKPASFLTREDDLLVYVVLPHYLISKLFPNTLVCATIDVKVSVEDGLRSQLEPNIVAIDHQHQIRITGHVHAIKICFNARDLSDMRSSCNQIWIFEFLVPIYESWSRVVQNSST